MSYIVNGFLFSPRKHSLEVFTKALHANVASGGGGAIAECFCTTSGIELHGALVNATRAPSWSDDVIFLLSGGNGALACEAPLSDLVRQLSAHGSVFVYDYRGYGCSGGTVRCASAAQESPTIPGVIKDAEAAWRFLTDARKVAPERIVLVGHSLGCAVSCSLMLSVAATSMYCSTPMRKRLPRSMLLWAPFLSVAEISRTYFGAAGAWFLHAAGIEWDNAKSLRLARIAAPEMPIVVLHGLKDIVIPWTHGQELARECKGRFVPLPLGTHNTLFCASSSSSSSYMEEDNSSDADIFFKQFKF